MTRKIGSFAAAATLMLGAACSTDLNISNPNNPDIERVLASPDDVDKLGKSSVRSWYINVTDPYPNVFSAVTSDIQTMNYGNFGARFNNLEPRIAYNNSSAATDGEVSQLPWDRMYAALGAANDVMVAYKGGLKLSTDAATEASKHLAMFTQAAALTQLALFWDRAFVVDEDTVAKIKAEPGYAPSLMTYAQVSAAALAKWDALIASTAGKSHTYGADVIPLQGGNLNSAKLNRIANTMAALLVAYTPRNPTEATAANWAKAAAYAAKGIGTGTAGAPMDFTVVGDNDLWYSEFLMYANYASWMRVDMRVINMIDPTQPVKYAGKVPQPKAAGDNRINTDFRFFGAAAERAEIAAPTRDTVIGDPARGIYMMSPYAHKRYEYHAWHKASYGTGPAPYILAAESDLVRAEALVRTNTDLATAAALINNTRVTRGGKTPVTAADGAAALLDAIRYERTIELIATNGWDLPRTRQAGQLQAGTARHLPIPAKELEILGMPNYTFGTTGKEQ